MDIETVSSRGSPQRTAGGDPQRVPRCQGPAFPVARSGFNKANENACRRRTVAECDHGRRHVPDVPGFECYLCPRFVPPGPGPFDRETLLSALKAAALLKDIADYYPAICPGAVRADLDGNLWILPTSSAQSKAGELIYDITRARWTEAFVPAHSTHGDSLSQSERTNGPALRHLAHEATRQNGAAVAL